MKFVLSSSFCPINEILELATVADQAGWGAISFSDHLVHPKELNTPYPYTQDGSRRWPEFTDWPDPFVMIGAIASQTTQIEFMNNVFVLPIRNPFAVAKTVSTAAIISNNRVKLCIGVGWSEDEFKLAGQEFKTRGKRCNESIEILRKLWQGGWVSYQGQHYQFDELEMSPSPSQTIPIWVGGISNAALKRAALLGDGWVSDLQSSQDIIDSIATIKAIRSEAGISNKEFGVMATPNDAFLPEHYKALEDSGVSHILTMPWAFYYGENPSLEEKKEAIRRFATDYF